MSDPRLFLTSMSSDPSSENPVEMVEPLLSHLDGVIWCLNDVPPDAPSARYLETVKGVGRVIHRFWPTGRHWVGMNDTLYTGLIQEGDYVLWCDDKERPAIEFVSRVKSEIGPMMQEADLDVIFAWGKAYLIRYRETLEYRNSPHWTLTGWNGRGLEWSTIESDERKVRLNVRPLKRRDPYHWVGHFAFYWLYPAGCNHAALGLDHFPGGATNETFAKREAKRLEFRREMRKRGFPMTLDGLKALLSGPLDEVLKEHLRAEKVLSDFYHYTICGRTDVRCTHNPADALPIP